MHQSIVVFINSHWCDNDETLLKIVIIIFRFLIKMFKKLIFFT
jgi:hypothetical protein